VRLVQGWCLGRDKLEKRKAAVVIQKHWRGYIARKVRARDPKNASNSGDCYYVSEVGLIKQMGTFSVIFAQLSYLAGNCIFVFTCSSIFFFFAMS